MTMMRSIPAMPVKDIDKAAMFYEIKLGFTVQYKDMKFAKLTRDHVEIHLWAASDTSWKLRGLSMVDKPIDSGAESFLAGTASCRIEVGNIDDLFTEYKKNEVLYNPSTIVEVTAWGTREFPILDLHRNLLTFFEMLK
jgi:uncharacterized protein YceK